jgi:YVTN family beta-propeller protein
MGIAYDGTNLYVANNQGSSVSVIDPARNTVTYTIPAGDRPRGVDYDGTNVWVTNAGDNTVSKLPPR